MARPRSKENVRRARTELYRQLILEAAERVFADKGIDDAKMEEIAGESGLSLGTLYSVFSGKAGLVRAVHDTRGHEVLQRSRDAARHATTPLEQLLLGVRGYVECLLANPDFLRIHLREGRAWGLAEAGAKSREQADAWKRGVEMYAAVFADGIEHGVFHAGEPGLMARMMLAMQQVQLSDWVERGMKREPGALVAEIEAQVRRSFCRQPD